MASTTSEHPDALIGSIMAKMDAEAKERVVPASEIKLDGLKLAMLPGTGHMGSGLARAFTKASFKVLVTSRELAKAEAKAEEIRKEFPAQAANVTALTQLDAAAAADVIFFAAMGSEAERTAFVHSLAPSLTGKIIVDLSNIGYLPSFTQEKWGQTSSIEQLIAALGEGKAQWVSAFKTTPMSHLTAPKAADGSAHHVLTAADDIKAGALVRALINSIGLHALDCGRLINNRIIELQAPMHMVMMLKLNADPAAVARGNLPAWRFQ